MEIELRSDILETIIVNHSNTSVLFNALLFHTLFQLLQDKQLMIIICALLCVDSAMMVLWIFVDPMQRKISNVTTEVCTIYVDHMQRKISNVTTGICTIYVDPMQRKIYNVTTEICMIYVDPMQR